jgi:uncharacterized membrane protein YhaH (DUF805 family)
MVVHAHNAHIERHEYWWFALLVAAELVCTGSVDSFRSANICCCDVKSC